MLYSADKKKEGEKLIVHIWNPIEVIALGIFTNWLMERLIDCTFHVEKNVLTKCFNKILIFQLEAKTFSL